MTTEKVWGGIGEYTYECHVATARTATEPPQLIKDLGDEAAAATRPDLFYPLIYLDGPRLGESQLLGDLRPAGPGELDALDSMAAGKTWSVLDEVNVWIRPADDPTAATATIRSRRVRAIIGDTLFSHHSVLDAKMVDDLRRGGTEVYPEFNFPLLINKWNVPVWEHVAQSQRWIALRLTSQGKVLTWVGINGSNVVVEI